jgi:hypothetical protein
MPDIPDDLPGKNTYYVEVVPYFNEAANQSRWGILPAKPTDLETYFTDNWVPGWADHEDDTERTHETNVDIVIFASTMDGKIRSICRDIPVNTLNTTDRIKILIAPESTGGSTINAQTTPPDIKWSKTIHLENDINLQNPLTPDSKAMPYGNKALILVYRGAAGLLDANIPWQFGGIAKTHIYRIISTVADVNLTLYVKALYFHLDKKGNACVMIQNPII